MDVQAESRVDINKYLNDYNEIDCEEEEKSDIDDEFERHGESDAENHYLSEVPLRNESFNRKQNEVSIVHIKVEPQDDVSSLSLANENSTETNIVCKNKKPVEIIRLGSTLPTLNSEVEINEWQNDTSNAGDIPDDDSEALEMVANIAEQAAFGLNESKSSLDLNEDGDSYQTVTVVPSDTNPGELSYVLFVSEGDEIDKNDEEMCLNLKNGTKLNSSYFTQEVGSDGVKIRTFKLPSKHAQILTQHMCNFCNYSSPKRYLVLRHMKTHSDERPHKCNICERGFKTYASLQNHVNTHTGTRPYPCKECDSCFTTSGELIRHIRYKHTHEKPHKCTECSYASVELSKLKRHMRCHTGERPYQCPHCTYASPDTYKLKRHVRIHTGEKPYECDICHARFTQSNSLKAHKLIHSGDKPVFHCEYCPTTCGRKTDLRIHMQKLHSIDRPHRCKRCNKVFLDRYSYKIHIKSHEGEKCYKCDLCSYASVSPRHLQSHMFIHTDQKPFKCDECEQSFRQKQLLKRHKNIYHDPNYIPPTPHEKNNICEVCNKAFRHKGNLARHLILHDPNASSLEKEIAMNIGMPKNLGESPDGEEDDYDFSLGSPSANDKNDDQVVVFEVIQLPSENTTDDYSFSILDGDNDTLIDDPQDLSPIESDKNRKTYKIGRRGRPPKYLKKSPTKVLQEHSLKNELSTEFEYQIDMPHNPKVISLQREEHLQKSLIECSEVNDEIRHDDSFLAITSTPEYQAFHNNLIDDIS